MSIVAASGQYDGWCFRIKGPSRPDATWNALKKANQDEGDAVVGLRAAVRSWIASQSECAANQRLTQVPEGSR